MELPVVSICIPTYKRARYLASLLESLCTQLADFPYRFELVIADNASPDTTAQVVQDFSQRLPIRYLRHDSNIGGYPNWQFVMSKALGQYLVYLSDDDTLLGEPLAAIIGKMQADPELAVVYAPWLLYDLVDDRQVGQFYSVPQDLRVERQQHSQLLDHILRHGIFPEIQVLRRSAFEATMPRINDHAFLAFMHASDYLCQGAVLIQQQPFYVAITRYFADENRDQLGTDETQDAWDRYRGGLEYMLARCGPALSSEERTGFHLRIQQLIAQRIGVAIRLRRGLQRDPIDSYYLGMRLRGMGYESMLPVPMETLAGEAMVQFMLRDPEITRGMKRMLCVGDSSASERDFLSSRAGMPVDFVSDLDDCDALSDTLLFVRQNAVAAQRLDHAMAAQRNVRVLREGHLAGKFGL